MPLSLPAQWFLCRWRSTRKLDFSGFDFLYYFRIQGSTDLQLDSCPAHRCDWRGVHGRCFSFLICPRQLHLELRTFLLGLVSGRHRFGVCLARGIQASWVFWEITSGAFLQSLVTVPPEENRVMDLLGDDIVYQARRRVYWVRIQGYRICVSPRSLGC